MKSLRSRVLLGIGLVLVGYICYNIYTNHNNSKIITKTFQQTYTLKTSIEDCFLKTNDVNLCSSGMNDIPTIKDNDKVMIVAQGNIYISFNNNENGGLEGGTINILFNPVQFKNHQEPWSCEYQNYTNSKLKDGILPKNSDCQLKYKNNSF